MNSRIKISTRNDWKTWNWWVSWRYLLNTDIRLKLFQVTIFKLSTHFSGDVELILFNFSIWIRPVQDDPCDIADVENLVFYTSDKEE